MSPTQAIKVAELGDFTTTRRVLYISALALPIGALATVVALVLLRLIGLFTQLFFFHTVGTTLVSPAGNGLGVFVVAVPVIGGLVIGLMARFGSERIRGHGIPEALESILINGSRVEPRLAILKPLSSAISIGSGGPFGAEGPIIMTGGAFGSLIAQFLHLTAAERKTLLVAGAAAGMAATFAAPVAAVLLAVELLLFEWKPRSAIPVALASATAGALRRYVIGVGPLFPVPPHPELIGPDGLIACVIVGLAAGALSVLLTAGVYAAEDAFRLLPIHWMWWPAIGGLVVGVGGLIAPQALGVGYDVIGQLLQGNAALSLVVAVLAVKSVIWAVSLGSGTSGGVLAPLLMMGGALGAIEAHVLPFEGAGFWPLVSMGAILAGTMRSPFTGVIFTLELTHDVNVLLPLLIASFVAEAVTVLALRRSILTEKVARRGYHLTREYAIDPLEILFVREVMRTSVVALASTTTLRDLSAAVQKGRQDHGVQRLYPVVDDDGRLRGIATRSDVQHLLATAGDGATIDGQLGRDAVVAYPDEPLRTVLFRMAETGLTRFPVVERGPDRRLVGMIAMTDLLKATQRHLEEERRRERVLRTRLKLPFRRRGRRELDVVVAEGADGANGSAAD
ncbi:MAG: chloride channel protein [Chloroflexota bacterium]|nr:chloride channel protein [Chloroflexota bacterium]